MRTPFDVNVGLSAVPGALPGLGRGGSSLRCAVADFEGDDGVFATYLERRAVTYMVVLNGAYEILSVLRLSGKNMCDVVS